MPLKEISVGIVTRNRLSSLIRCVTSLSLIQNIIYEIIVFDDASDVPVESGLMDNLSDTLRAKTRVVRSDANDGAIVGRNKIASLASAAFLLSLDDDAMILNADGICQAFQILEVDETVGAIAFAQANADGSLWPATMQPAPVDYSCEVPTFVGFAVLLRNDLFNRLGGYRELFYFYGEEKEYCLRMLDRDYHTIYLPGAHVAHIPDLAGRSQKKYLRFVTRNDCLGVLYNQPLVLVPALICWYLLANFRFRRHLRFKDPGVMRYFVMEIVRNFAAIWRERQAVKWKTLARWRRIKKTHFPYSISLLSNSADHQPLAIKSR